MPNRKTPSALTIATAAAGAGPVTPERKRFTKLLGQIDAARARLQAWQQNLPAFAAAHQAQVVPVYQRLAVARRVWAFELEQLLLSQKWSRTEKETLAQLIVELAEANLDNEAPGNEPAEDPELQALHDRHAEVDRATVQQQQLEHMKVMLEDMSGIDLGDAPAESAEELLERAQQQMAQQRERFAAEGAARAPQHAQAARKPRSPRATASQKRAEEDAQRVTQTVREVYRKLAATLHPDRAGRGATPEQQALQHERMARANTAYAAGDLLSLLTLQLEIEQVSAAQAANLAPEQVRHFNRVLAEQLAEIDAEVVDREMAFMGSYGIALTSRPHPDKLNTLLKDALRDALAAEVTLQHDRRLLRGERASARRYLKQLAAEYRMADRFGDDFGLLPF